MARAKKVETTKKTVKRSVGGKRGRKRKQAEKERDRALIAEMYLQAMSINDITKKLNERDRNKVQYQLSRQTISEDLQHCKKVWQEKQISDISEAIGVLGAELDLMIKCCWEDYHETRKAESITKEDDAGNTVSKIKRSKKGGSMAIMQRLESLWQKKYMLYGLNLIPSGGPQDGGQQPLNDIPQLTEGQMKILSHPDFQGELINFDEDFDEAEIIE